MVTTVIDRADRAKVLADCLEAARRADGAELRAHLRRCPMAYRREVTALLHLAAMIPPCAEEATPSPEWVQRTKELLLAKIQESEEGRKEGQADGGLDGDAGAPDGGRDVSLQACVAAAGAASEASHGSLR